MQCAIVQGHLQMVELLLACGADKSAFVDKASLCLSGVQSLNLRVLNSACSLVRYALSSCECKVTWHFDPGSLITSQDSLCMWTTTQTADAS